MRYTRRCPILSAAIMMAVIFLNRSARADTTMQDNYQLQDVYNLFEGSTEVVVASKSSMRADDAPAIVSVISQATLQARGFRNIGEALSAIPGIYISDNRVTHAVGMRGVGASTNSWGQIIKVLINGQPATDYATGGSLLGPEFLPIEAVKSIEVVRGPGSALYGANAYLGVVNVVTRDVGPAAALEIAGTGGVLSTHFADGGSAVGMVSSGPDSTPASLLLAVSLLREDRSGTKIGGNAPARLLGRSTQGDTSQPISAFLRGQWQPAGLGEISVQAVYQHLDAHDEFSQYGVLSSQTRLAMEKLFGRIEHRYRLLGDALQIHSFAGLSNGRDLPAQLFYINNNDVLHRERSDSTWELGTEVSLVASIFYFLAGVDYTSNSFSGDKIRLETADHATRLVTSGLPHSYAATGVYAQVIASPLDNFTLTAGARYDLNNTWGNNASVRAAANYRALDNLHFKLLYGTSLVPPSPSMLYAAPIGVAVNELVGSTFQQTKLSLKPETADTLEASVSYTYEFVNLQLNAFYTRAYSRFEAQPFETYTFLVNLTSSTTVGGEAILEGRWPYIFVVANASLSLSEVDALNPQPVWFALLYGASRPQTNALPSFPIWMGHATVGTSLPDFFVEGTATLNVYGARSASVNNTFFLHKAYSLPAYATVDLHVRTMGIRVDPDFGVEASIHVNNLFNQAYADTGVLGVDIPSTGRSASLRLSVAL